MREADVDQAVEKSTRCDDDRVSVVDLRNARFHALDPAVGHQDSLYEGLF